MTILLVLVEVEVVQIDYLTLQVQSDQHEPELLGSPRSFYRSCSSPLIPDQHSKGICSRHCPSFVHLCFISSVRENLSGARRVAISFTI